MSTDPTPVILERFVSYYSDMQPDIIPTVAGPSPVRGIGPEQ